MPRVLIGYAPEDTKQAMTCADALRDVYGYGEVWYDDAATRGQLEWKRRMRDRFRSCELVVMLISSAALRSPYTHQLLEQADTAGKSIVLAVLGENLSVKGVPQPVREVLKAHRRVRVDRPDGAARLVTAARMLVPPPRPGSRAKSKASSNNILRTVLILATILGVVAILGYAAFVAFTVFLTLEEVGPYIAFDAETYMERGDRYRHDGEYELALEDYNEVIRLEPDSSLAYNRRGLVYAELKAYDLALADYNTALRLSPNDAVVIGNMAIVYSEVGDHEQSRATYNEALRLAPDDPVIHSNSGYNLMLMGDYEAALNAFNTSLQLRPDSALTTNIRGIAYRELGDYEQALVDHNTALSYDPAFYRAYVERGITFMRMERYDAALADLSHAVQLNPERSEAFAALGDAHYALGAYPAATAAYRDYERLAGELEPEMAARLAEMGTG